jgi:hypothetical protein
MSVTLHELKQTLEQSMNAFVEERLVANSELNIRHVEDEIVKLYNTAKNISGNFKQFYARHYDADQPDRKVEILSYLAEYRATHFNPGGTNNHYGSELIDALYKKTPIEQSPETKSVISNVIKALMLKIENSTSDYQQGVYAATNAISNIKSSNLKAELYLIKSHASKMASTALESTDLNVRKSESHYANGVLSAVEIAEHMLPFKELSADEVLDSISFPRPEFNFKGHDVILNCPGLKQTVLFLNAIKAIEGFSSSNSEIAWTACSALKRPLLGQLGRDTESIVKGLVDGKRAVLSELQSNQYLSEERKQELNSSFKEAFKSVAAEIKNALQQGAVILQAEKQFSQKMSLG